MLRAMDVLGAWSGIKSAKVAINVLTMSGPTDHR